MRERKISEEGLAHIAKLEKAWVEDRQRPPNKPAEVEKKQTRSSMWSTYQREWKEMRKNRP